MFESGKLSNVLDDAQTISPCHCETKIVAHHEIFLPNTYFPHFSSRREVLRKSVEYLWWYSICCWHSVQLESGKISKCCLLEAKFSPCNCNTKIASLMKFSSRKCPIFHIFRAAAKDFLKSVEYLWWYSIFSDTVYMLESGKLSNFDYLKKVFTLPLQN